MTIILSLLRSGSARHGSSAIFSLQDTGASQSADEKQYCRRFGYSLDCYLRYYRSESINRPIEIRSIRILLSFVTVPGLHVVDPFSSALIAGVNAVDQRPGPERQRLLGSKIMFFRRFVVDREQLTLIAK